VIWKISLEVLDELNLNYNFLSYLDDDDKLQVIHHKEDVLEHCLSVVLSVWVRSEKSLNQKETWDIDARVVDHSLEENEADGGHEVNRVELINVVAVNKVSWNLISKLLLSFLGLLFLQVLSVNLFPIFLFPGTSRWFTSFLFFFIIG
jgi:hypothetical protein